MTTLPAHPHSLDSAATPAPPSSACSQLSDCNWLTNWYTYYWDHTDYTTVGSSFVHSKHWIHKILGYHPVAFVMMLEWRLHFGRSKIMACNCYCAWSLLQKLPLAGTAWASSTCFGATAGSFDWTDYRSWSAKVGSCQAEIGLEKWSFLRFEHLPHTCQLGSLLSLHLGFDQQSWLASVSIQVFGQSLLDENLGCFVLLMFCYFGFYQACSKYCLDSFASSS